jgi:hypothetical protein
VTVRAAPARPAPGLFSGLRLNSKADRLFFTEIVFQHSEAVSSALWLGRFASHKDKKAE